MADNFQSIFASDLFTFFVGQDQKPIIVHSAAISMQSKALNALVNGGMVESQTRTCPLKDIEEEDFIRFCQFAYTGDYATPPFTEKKIPPVNGDEVLETTEPGFYPDQWAMPSKKSKKDKKRSISASAMDGFLEADIISATRSSTEAWTAWGVDVSQVNYQEPRTLRTNFENREFCNDLPRQKFLISCEPVANTQPNQNFEPVFLTHCRLYIFADKYGVDPLVQLALQKLHQTLVRFELYPERIQDVVELVRFAYTDDNTKSDGTDELRALVTIYMASRIDKLNASEPFFELLEEGGAFVRDFWMLVRNALYV